MSSLRNLALYFHNQALYNPKIDYFKFNFFLLIIVSVKEESETMFVIFLIIVVNFPLQQSKAISVIKPLKGINDNIK